MNDINIGAPAAALPLANGQVAARRSEGFRETLKSAVAEVNQLQQTADAAAEKVVHGEMGIPEGMLAMGKADLSLRLMLQVRNKAMDAYREIMQMSV
jgi:flagellar hook-basal body complex protein FliE